MADNETNNNDTTATTTEPLADEADNAEAPPAAPLSTKRKASEESDNRLVTLESYDGQQFQLPWKAARQSGMIRTALCGDDDEEEEAEEENEAAKTSLEQQTVPVQKVMGPTLEKVVEFLIHLEQEHFKSIPLPLPGISFDECMTQEWYRNFVNEGVAESEMAFGLLEAGHYMDIRPLIELMCLRITFVEFADRSWEELQAMFNNEAPPSAAASTNEEAAAAAAPAVEAGGDN